MKESAALMKLGWLKLSQSWLGVAQAHAASDFIHWISIIHALFDKYGGMEATYGSSYDIDMDSGRKRLP